MTLQDSIVVGSYKKPSQDVCRPHSHSRKVPDVQLVECTKVDTTGIPSDRWKKTREQVRQTES